MLMSVSPEVKPLAMTVTRRGPYWELSVVGATDTLMQVSYELETTSGTGNLSVQRGRATLSPGRRVELLRVMLGQASGGWSANLKVQTPMSTYTEAVSRLK